MRRYGRRSDTFKEWLSNCEKSPFNMWIGFQRTEFRIPKAPKPGFSIAHTNISLMAWGEMIKLNAVVQGA